MQYFRSSGVFFIFLLAVQLAFIWRPESFLQFLAFLVLTRLVAAHATSPMEGLELQGVDLGVIVARTFDRAVRPALIHRRPLSIILWPHQPPKLVQHTFTISTSKPTHGGTCRVGWKPSRPSCWLSTLVVRCGLLAEAPPQLKMPPRLPATTLGLLEMPLLRQSAMLK